MKRGWNDPGLEAAAQYIEANFKTRGLVPRAQVFSARNRTFRNIIVELGPVDRSTIVIGAHYDSYGSLPGADDNASGVAALIELSAMLQSRKNSLKYRYVLAAWPLEEPPFFATPQMGSYVHAAALKKAKENIRLMISLEMLGYYSDTPKSQSFPIAAMANLYPTTGNFITLVGRPGEAQDIAQLKASFRRAKLIPTEAVIAPPQVKGIDFSDHRNFWSHGYRALMITDTSFYRNHNYHEKSDTPDRLDYKRMSAVVKSLDMALAELKPRPKASAQPAVRAP